MMPTPTPTPYPTSGDGAPGSWSCVYAMVTPGGGANPYATGEDCAVTEWESTTGKVRVVNTPLPVTGDAGGGTSSPAACPSPYPAAGTADAACQTAADVHRLVTYSVPAFAVIGLLLIAALVVAVVPVVRRVA